MTNRQDDLHSVPGPRTFTGNSAPCGILLFLCTIFVYKYCTLFSPARIYNVDKSIRLLSVDSTSLLNPNRYMVRRFSQGLRKRTFDAMRNVSASDHALFAAKFCTLAAEKGGEESGGGPCLPPFVEIREEFVRKIVVVPKYKLLSCILPKCMSTTMTMIFSYLYRNSSFDNVWWPTAKKSATHHLNDFDSLRTMQQHLGVDEDELRADWSMNVVVRDPLHRFVSAFVDKCIFERTHKTLDPLLYGGGELCYGCGSNLTCFLLMQYTRARNYANGIPAFVGYEDQHTFPQSWFCNLREYMSNYNIHRPTSDHDGHQDFLDIIHRLLKSRGVPQREIHMLRKRVLHSADDFMPLSPQVSANRTNPMLDLTVDPSPVRRARIRHAAEKRREILGNRLLLSAFLAMFYHDYVVFNYSLPDLSALY